MAELLEEGGTVIAQWDEDSLLVDDFGLEPEGHRICPVENIFV